ncbi:ABC transporter ATP-binding protein [Acidisoma silvae]|uniref:ABC transporter ATP-binding protein n=1 Tax=Acidisoma silvae TaxID=2802396 RepID=A0A963YVV1_9PROT|nr:ABC transporter ATP-binding protein [Acidisoma silvae]MCB8877794.1 ABC transporter ATP-binding protein [Acidisoma silvae]
MAAPLLELERLSVVYEPAILAVEDVSFSIWKGEIVALLGANGAGKTSLLRAISNLLRAKRGRLSKGHIIYDGQRVERVPTHRLVETGLVQVLEGRHCFLFLTVEENLLTGALGRRSSRGDAKDDLGRVYEVFPSLKAKAKQPAGLLSGGQQQMLAIGRALMARPNLLLLDEPSMGLAPLLAAEIFETLAKLNRDDGLTILLAEQNAASALHYASRAFVLENGRLASGGPTADLLARDDILSAYLGLVSEKIVETASI